MSCKLTQSAHDPECQPDRPSFNQQNTQDRLREADLRRPSMTSKIRKDRKSVFREVGLASEDERLEGLDQPQQQDLRGPAPAAQNTRSATPRGRVTDGAEEGKEQQSSEDPDALHTSQRQETGGQQPSSDSRTASPPQSPTTSTKTPWYARLATGSRPRVRTASNAPPSPFQGLPTMTMLALAIAVVAPLYSRSSQDAAGIVDAGPIVKRADSPTDVCARWAHQTALLNGTLYIYGGEAKSSVSQENNTWNNDFLTLDLTSSWDTTSPSLTGLPQPSGPPAVALGYLWNDYNNLYLYGGEFADNPYNAPAAIATWQYDISAGIWTSYTNLQTSAGNASDGGGVAVQRAAEGAGVSVPELGLSWYFGGHLDYLTTPGWSDQVARVYLKSLLEFTHPGYTNDAVTSLSGTGAPASGVYRNITQGGLQSSSTFSERADGALVFVPGWGVSGVLIGLAGGTASAFTNDMSQLDVYDIASSQWYHQQTTGTAPGVRVNPCAIVASAPDASSFNIYLFGGQNLQPAGNQIQYDDMYILTIPSFTWIGPISQSGSPIPSARAGHTCDLRDGQIILVGGFNTTATDCDSPGIYVFNASSLQWGSTFTALSTLDDADLDPGNSVLSDSYGYTVPDEVISVIGGSPAGSATVTTPAVSATGGPFATGRSPVYTITASGSGATATITSGAGSSGTGSAGNSSSSNDDGGLIAAVVVACLAGLSAGYMGYCAWLYRRQVRAYKTHLAVTNRFPARSASHGSFGRMLAFGRSRGSGSRRVQATDKLGHRRDDSGTSSAGGDSFAWVGREKLLDPASASASGGSNRPSPWGSEGKSGGGSYGSGEASGEASGSGRPRTSDSSASSTDGLLEGQEPSFFSVVLGPRRALRVVNGLEEGEGMR